ncbi:stage VI sporulation protein D [Halalkalibacter nanhaiisediminis]|uniref:stage VI sporulation protein D n=1 Tax=Halalkalibacter nanhaiisediminis TaxID=688079 RepID=UPI001315A275|nr:stage VI sporulation protein D [Halalkalibacter nanhaiisediminis]
MTQEHPSKLSFSIEESVWLNKGQEVEEVLGMSLEPEIVIEERDQHVYIKGGLNLIGDYQPVDQAEVINTDSHSLEELVSFRSPGEIEISENGIGKIKHFFPIDVTIPISRIQNLDDVYVQVDSFDYDLPEKSCIQLTADISISGMTSQQEDTTVKRSSKEDDVPTLEPVPTAFAFEAKKQPVLEDPPYVNEYARVKKPDSLLAYDPKKEPNFSQSHREIIKEQDTYDTNNELDQQVKDFEKERQLKKEINRSLAFQKEIANESLLKKEVTVDEVNADQFVKEDINNNLTPLKAQTNESALTKEAQVEEVTAVRQTTEHTAPVIKVKESPVLEEARQEEQMEEREEVDVPQRTEETKVTLVPLKENTAISLSEEQQKQEEEPEEKKRPTYREENALYLTKMLSKGEERFTKWKMCIIQQHESLETIASRYDVTTNQLVRINRLQKEQVEEGQILYIPVSDS